jgi:Mn2+/Fe2+ NRAMP family transporter
MILHNLKWEGDLQLIPSMPNETALYIAIGIIGATVMPHSYTFILFGAKPEGI